MKGYFPKLCILMALMLACAPAFKAGAQLKSAISAWDRDVRELRSSMLGNFSFDFDDYLQFAPGMAMITLKLSGVESRSSWERMAVSDACSFGLAYISAKGIKNAIKRTRPDGESLSFPSGHTTMAFMSASMLHKEYGVKYPWISFGGYSLAMLTGISRLANDRHWMSDTVAGALIGVCSVEAGYLIGDMLFDNKPVADGFEHYRFCYNRNDYKGFSLQTGADMRRIPGAQGSKPCRGAAISGTAEFPFTRKAGTLMQLSLGSLTDRQDNLTKMATADVGVFCARDMLRCMEVQVQAKAGLAYESGDKYGFHCAAGASMSIVSAENFKLRGILEWDRLPYYTDGKSHSLHSVLLGYRAIFFL